MPGLVMTSPTCSLNFFQRCLRPPPWPSSISAAIPQPLLSSHQFRFGPLSGPSSRLTNGPSSQQQQRFAAGAVHADGTPCGSAASASSTRHSVLWKPHYTVAVHAATVCACRTSGGSACGCCRKFIPRIWVGTSNATRRSRWIAAQCGGPACQQPWRSTSEHARPAN